MTNAGTFATQATLAAETTKVIGTVNQGTSPWVTADAADGPVAAGTAAAKSTLIGAQFNSTLPTLTNGQQAAAQCDSSGRLIVAPIVQGTVTDRSGSAGATSTQIMAANTARRFLFIQNISNAPIYFNFTSAASVGSGSIELSQFSSFVMEGSFVSTEAVNIIRSGGSNLAFTAKEG